ncbi:MAG: type II toxin-antitoxin system PemK/MazF family toxin [Chloroflexota bacterium]|nr:type II toxin-antitoxin system PemK/MazF family toxin [Chloroflexota bacterium]
MTNTTKPTILRGEIWLVDFDPAVGDEQKKKRPALVMNPDTAGRLRLRVIVPVTTWQDHFVRYPWFVRLTPTPLNGLDKESAADGFQIRCLSEQRFRFRIGILTDQQISEIAAAIAFSVGYISSSNGERL